MFNVVAPQRETVIVVHTCINVHVHRMLYIVHVHACTGVNVSYVYFSTQELFSSRNHKNFLSDVAISVPLSQAASCGDNWWV